MITQEQECTQFIANWRNKSPKDRPQIIQEIASWHRESNRYKAKGIDYYLYDVDENGKFISPDNGEKITANINQQRSLGQIETEVVVKEEQQRELGEEVFIWISPQYPDTYFDLKLTITNRVTCKGRERFENRAILFDLKEEQGLELAQKLAGISKNRPLLSSLEEIRRTLLILDANLDWIEMLVNATGDEELGEIIKTGADKMAKEESLLKAEQFYDDLLGGPSVELKVGMGSNYGDYGFGDALSSCPVILDRTNHEYWRRGNCRWCGRTGIEVGPCFVCKKCEEADNQKNNLLAWVA